MDVLVESSGALASAVRAAVGRADLAASWARWTLTLARPPAQGGAVRAAAWRLLTRGPLVPVGPDLEAELAARFGPRAGSAARQAHRLQVAALLLEDGRPSRLEADLGRGGGFSMEEAAALALAARGDLARLLSDLDRLYPEGAGAEGGPLRVSWTGDAVRADAFVGEPCEGARPWRPEPAAVPFVRDDAALASLARRLFGVPELRPGQAEAAAALLAGRDLRLELPTGGGKSLPVHLAALLAPGAALLVAPLRALLRDQARRLAESGTRVALLCGDEPGRDAAALADLASGASRVVLAAPERLDSARFRAALRAAAETAGFSLAAVDEAHCAARRGHDWRPAYRVLGARLREWCSVPGRVPALAALSGSGGAAALAEAERVLGLGDPARVRTGGARANLFFRVRSGGGPDLVGRLRQLLTRGIPGGRWGPGIVFCPRVDGPLGAPAVSEELAWTEGIDAPPYTGRPPAGAEPAPWEAAKARAAAEFLAGRRGLLCATRAFGLGVDRPDVRFTAHLGLPASLEELLQQAGRAGRDGLPAECWLLLDLRGPRRARRWARLPLEALRAEVRAPAPRERDDVCRAYELHLGSFPGLEAELRDVEVALRAGPDVGAAGPAVARAPGQDGDALTRALLRLEDAGVLSLERRVAGGWRVLRPGGWSAQAALASCAAAVERDYRCVEPARRASLAGLIELVCGPDAEAALARSLAAATPGGSPAPRACPRPARTSPSPCPRPGRAPSPARPASATRRG